MVDWLFYRRAYALRFKLYKFVEKVTRSYYYTYVHSGKSQKSYLLAFFQYWTQQQSIFCLFWKLFLIGELIKFIDPRRRRIPILSDSPVANTSPWCGAIPTILGKLISIFLSRVPRWKFSECIYEILIYWSIHLIKIRKCQDVCHFPWFPWIWYQPGVYRI